MRKLISILFFAAVASQQCTAQPARDLLGLATDAERSAQSVFDHHRDGRIARDAPGRFGRDVPDALDGCTDRGRWIGQGLRCFRWNIP